MKNYFFCLQLLYFLLLVPLTFSQIPNHSFENWTNGNPDNWMTNNITGYVEPVTQSNDAHSGNYSVKMEMMIAMSSLLQPVITVGEYGLGFPVSQRYKVFVTSLLFCTIAA